MPETMTPAELIAAMSDPRLPTALIALNWRETVALLALGLLLSLIIFAAIRPLSNQRPSRRARIQATRGQPGPERILSVARILGYLPDTLRPAAYGAAPPPDDATIEKAARARPRLGWRR